MIQTILIFATSNSCAGKSFFGLLSWWYYLPSSDFQNPKNACDITNFSPLSPSGIPLVLLAVIDDLLRIAGMLAIGYMLYGAVQYITSRGNPEQTAQALSTIINALTGIAIAMVAVVFVSFLGNKLGG